MPIQHGKLLIAYFENREKPRCWNSDLDKFNIDNPWVDIDRFRDEWYGLDSDEDQYSPNSPWEGWREALIQSGGEYSEKEMELATMLDKRKLITRELGDIKRHIYRSGKSLAQKNKTCTADEAQEDPTETAIKIQDGGWTEPPKNRGTK